MTPLEGLQFAIKVRKLTEFQWMAKYFEISDEGFIGWKTFNSFFPPPKSWKICSGSVLCDNHYDNDKKKQCAPGIHIGTREWFQSYYIFRPGWRMLIKFEDIETVTVPLFNIDISKTKRSSFKIRCKKATILDYAWRRDYVSSFFRTSTI